MYTSDKIIEYLTKQKTATVKEIQEDLKLTYSELQVALNLLEIKGIIKENKSLIKGSE